jgi:hypothetical protein
VPSDNKTILGLAKELAARNEHVLVAQAGDQQSSQAKAQRSKLESVIRYRPVSVSHALRMANSKGMNFESISYRFDQSNGLSATGIFFKQDVSPASEPIVVVLNDNGYKAASQQVFDALSSAHEVLALDLLFTGASKPDIPDSSDWELLVDSSGDRSLGIEAAQLLSVMQWLRSTRGTSEITVNTNGIRSQMIALVAAAISPGAFSGLDTQGGMRSLEYLLDKPVPLRSAPDLFCLDLYSYFDIDLLRALAAPVKITQVNPLEH